MRSRNRSQGILLFVQQHYWSHLFTRALESVGYFVCVLDSSQYIPPQACLQGLTPALVILDCPQIDLAEQNLIRQVLADKHHLLILSASPSWEMMRDLFLQGVDDIVDKPYNPEHFVTIVRQVIASTTPRNSYQAVERQGQL